MKGANRSQHSQCRNRRGAHPWGSITCTGQGGSWKGSPWAQALPQTPSPPSDEQWAPVLARRSSGATGGWVPGAHGQHREAAVLGTCGVASLPTAALQAQPWLPGAGSCSTSSCCAMSQGGKHIHPNLLPVQHRTGTPTTSPPLWGPAWHPSPLCLAQLLARWEAAAPCAPCPRIPWAFPMLFPSLISTACRSRSSHRLGSLPWHSLHRTALPAAPRGQGHGPAEQR